MQIDQEAPVLHCDEVDSTNTHLARIVLGEGSTAPSGIALWASRQNKGRGRDGRVWLSSDEALTFSLMVEASESELEWLTALAGVALLRTIRNMGLASAEDAKDALSLKWPNDLLINGRKAAGILCEHLDTSGDTHRVVIGIGLNIGALPAQVRDFAASFDTALSSEERESFIRELRMNLELLFAAAGAPKSWRDEYSSHMRFFGTQCPLHLPGGIRFTATPISIDEHAHLICRSTEGEILTVTTGEISPTPLVEGHLS
jgi:biotin--[acetyl-coA-carboxylase] ligase